MDQLEKFALEAIKEQIEALRTLDTQNLDEVEAKTKTANMVCYLADRILAHIGMTR